MEFVYKQLDKSYLEKIFEIQDEVFQEGYDENMLRYHTKEILHNALSHDNYSLGAFYRGELAGFIMLQYYDALKMDNEDLVKIKSASVGNINTIYLIIVRKHFRGFGLQRKLLHEIEKILDKNSVINATVSPSNKYSLDNFLACGYKILSLKKMYGGYDRFLVYKEVKSKFKIDKAISE